jgi:hypothetical protein
MANGDFPDFPSYTKKQRRPLFVLLDHTEDFELRKP